MKWTEYILRVVEAKEMGIECYVCNKWSQNKCEKIAKEEFNVLRKKGWWI